MVEVEVIPLEGLIMSTYHQMTQTSQSEQRQHLRRSNAIRIKSKNFNILSPNLRQSILTSLHNRNNHHQQNSLHSLTEAQCIFNNQSSEFSFLDQIRRGVTLHPTGHLPMHERERLQQSEKVVNCSGYEEQECLADILRRVLADRYRAMQQSDDEESDLSSIESQVIAVEQLSSESMKIQLGDGSSRASSTQSNVPSSTHHQQVSYRSKRNDFVCRL